MRVGFVQFCPLLCDVDANLQTIEHLVDQASADLLVLPELALTGYALPDRRTAYDLAEPIPGPSTERLCGLSRRNRMHLVVGMAERSLGRVYNSAVLIGPAGVAGIARKTHLFADEPDLFEPGDTGFWTFEVASVRVGMMICFDWAFPESAGTLARRGAHIVAHPANLVLPHAQKAMPIRCLENRVFAITCNRWGTENGPKGPLRFSGNSIIVSPEGQILASGPTSENDIKIVNINPFESENKYLTPRNHVIADRRPVFYN